MVTISNLQLVIFQPLQGNEAAIVIGGIASPEPPLKEDSVQPSSTSASTIANGQQWSPSLQQLLDQPPSSLPTRLIAGGIAFCCIFGAWAWFGQVQDVSYAQGRLIPQGEVYRVQPVDAGEVAQITVAEGESVKAGQTIAELDNRLAQTELDRLKQSLAALQLERVQKQSMIERLQTELSARRSITDAEVRAQAAAISEVQAREGVSQKTIEQLQSEIVAHQVRLDRIRPLVETGALAQDHLFDVEQAIRQFERTLTQNQGELQDAQSQEQQLQAELTQKQAEGKTQQLQTQQQIQQLQVELSQISAKIQDTQNLIKSAETKFGKLFLKAPVDGVVSSLAVRNAGQVIQSGQTFAEIAPQKASLVLSTTMPSGEAGFVRVGMPVQIKFDAFPYQDYGVVPGRVTTISPDVRMDEKLGAVYRVDITIDRSALSEKQQKLQFKTGQTASAEIVTRQRRIIDVLLEPIKRLQAENINL